RGGPSWRSMPSLIPATPRACQATRDSGHVKRDDSASADTPRRPDIVEPVASPAASEADIVAVGRDLAAALPGASRNPLKAIDDKAMDLASQDADLRAALFRFVDVVPACRSLDDLARH